MTEVSQRVRPDRFDYHIAQLRHAYQHLMDGRVINQREFAEGLIGPAIASFEEWRDGEN